MKKFLFGAISLIMAVSVGVLSAVTVSFKNNAKFRDEINSIVDTPETENKTSASEDELSRLYKEISKLENQIIEKEEELELVNAELESAQNENATNEELIASLNSKKIELESEKEQLEIEMEELEAEIQDLESKFKFINIDDNSFLFTDSSSIKIFKFDKTNSTCEIFLEDTTKVDFIEFNNGNNVLFKKVSTNEIIDFDKTNNALTQITSTLTDFTNDLIDLKNGYIVDKYICFTGFNYFVRYSFELKNFEKVEEIDFGYYSYKVGIVNQKSYYNAYFIGQLNADYFFVTTRESRHSHQKVLIFNVSDFSLVTSTLSSEISSAKYNYYTSYNNGFKIGCYGYYKYFYFDLETKKLSFC